MKIKLKFIRNIVLLISIVILSFGAGFNVAKNPNLNVVSNVPLEERTQKFDLSLFWDVYERVSRLYYDKKAIDIEKMLYGAISGMVASLGDPYTVFLPPKQNKEAKDDLKGNFEGIGIQLGVKDKKIVIIAPLKGTPGEKAGLKTGDVILKVDGSPVDNLTLPEVVSKIRGKKGTEVVLTILHKDASSGAEIKVVRDTISIASVEWEKKYWECEAENKCEVSTVNCDFCQKVIYLKLNKFGDNTYDEWRKAVSAVKREFNNDSKIKGIVFDLRNNPGGYLSGSVFIASEFLKDGTVVIQEGAKGKKSYNVDRTGELTDNPMVVLVNKGTASASEIVSGALKERGRAKLVGDTTFGKGSIQEAQDLAGGAGIHITTAKWLLPSGAWINSTGIEPDVKIENDENKPDEDLQLNRAIELLITGK